MTGDVLGHVFVHTFPHESPLLAEARKFASKVHPSLIASAAVAHHFQANDKMDVSKAEPAKEETAKVTKEPSAETTAYLLLLLVIHLIDTKHYDEVLQYLLAHDTTCSLFCRLSLRLLSWSRPSSPCRVAR